MRRNLWFSCFALAVLFLASASASFATTVKGRSAYGNGPGSDSTLTFNMCADGTYSLINCEVFGTASVGTATFNGTTTLNIVQFAFNSGSGGQILDVINLGALASGTTFTLTSSLFNPANLEIFSCADAFGSLSSDATSLQDSGGNMVPGSFCTPDLLATPLTTSTLTLNNATTGQFTLNQDVGDLVLDFTPGSSTAAPEPASLALLGFGLAAIGAKLRRKAA